jgi:hypothetical protein
VKSIELQPGIETYTRASHLVQQYENGKQVRKIGYKQLLGCIKTVIHCEGFIPSSLKKFILAVFTVQVYHQRDFSWEELGSF